MTRGTLPPQWHSTTIAAMKKLILGLLALLALGSPAAAQTLPANTVVGRLGIGPGPSQAIPFTVFTSNLNTIVGAVQSVKTFGAICDGVTDDTIAVGNALAAGLASTPPGAICKVSTAANALSGRIAGFGQIKDGSNSFRGSFFSSVSANQAYTASNEDSIDTAFNQGGSFAKVQFPVEHRITGAATLTQPTTGYVYSPWAYPHYTYLFNSSGWNQATAGNDGRTAAAAYRTVVANFGQGDAVAYNCNGVVAGSRAGATNFLANPNVTCINGGLFAGSDGVFINASEIDLDDQGHDAAGIGLVNNLKRTNNTGALGVTWGFYSGQSIGSKAVDFGIRFTGPIVTALDFTLATFSASQIAAALPGNSRIYWNATSSGTFTVAPGAVYTNWNSSASGLDFVVANNSPSLRLAAVATPVNFIQVQGRETAVSPIISAQGADTNLGMILTAKGTGAISFRTRDASLEQFAVIDTASATRNIQVTGSNGGNPIMSTTAGGLTVAPSDGRLNLANGTPTASACAGFALSAGSSTAAGRVTYTSATTCVINFGPTFTNAPFCNVTPGTAASTLFITTSTTQLSVTFGTAQTAFFYHCFGA